jgi:hypothetical protein
MKTRTVLVLCATAALIASEAAAYNVNRKTNEITLTSLEDFSKCMRDYGDYQSEFCLDGLNAFVKKNKKHAFEAGKLVRLNMKHWAALPFFEIAMGSMKTAQFCKEEDVHLSVISGLGLPAGRKNDDKLIKIAQTIATNKCWDNFKAPINKELETDTGYFKANACAGLKSRKIAQKVCDAPAVAETKPAETVDTEIVDLAKADLSKIEIAESGVKVFSGDEGRRITIVRVLPESSNRVLIKFEGFRGPWNGRTLLHIERPAGNDGFDYATNVDGSAWNSVVKRGGYEVYPNGDKGPFWVSYSEEHSGKASARAILKDFKSDVKRNVAGH